MISLRWSWLALPLCLGCATLRDDLASAEAQYETARYDEALVWLEAIEDEMPRLDENGRAKYYFLRGMASLRLERRDDAMHFLALAREEVDAGATLGPAWTEMLTPTLEELTPTGPTHHARTSGGEEVPAEAGSSE